MDFDFSPDQIAFRDQVEKFLDENDDPIVFDVTRENMAQVADIPDAPFETLDIAPVPEPKTAKNRVHLDVFGDVAAIAARGATVLAEQPRWTVMADPEGNEFCVFPRP